MSILLFSFKNLHFQEEKIVISIKYTPELGKKIDFVRIRLKTHYPPQTQTTSIRWKTGLKH